MTTPRARPRTALRAPRARGNAASRQAMPRKYPAGHYESSACNGLGRAGNVCPGMLLPCMILKDTVAFEPSQLLPMVNCSVMPLLGLGFNPSIVPIDASLLPAGLNLLRPPAYLAADRYHRNNNMVPCHNPNVHKFLGKWITSLRVAVAPSVRRVCRCWTATFAYLAARSRGVRAASEEPTESPTAACSGWRTAVPYS